MFTAQTEWDCPENFPDLSDAKYIAIDLETKDPDPEHRLFFVGITRAKENLYLPQATGDYQYNIGGPIV